MGVMFKNKVAHFLWTTVYVECWKFHLQVVLVYLQRSRCSSLLKCVAASNRELFFTKTPYFGLQGHSRSSVLVPPESSSAVLVTMSRKSVSICNRSLARLDDSSRNRAFGTGYPNLMQSYGGPLQPRGSNPTPSKSTLNAKHFVCRLSMSISNGFGTIHS